MTRITTATSPGRVNLIGEHTDYNDGLALPMAIHQQARVQVDDAPAAVDESPSPYIQGVLDALREAGHDVPPLRVRLESDVPIGAGLSSSAALTCATALAVNERLGLGLERSALVQVAVRAENHFVGAPTGMLDQSASLLCEPGHALLLDCRTRRTRQVPVDLADLHLLVIDTGVRHEHASGGYAERRRECERAAEVLGLKALRDATEQTDLGCLPEALARRVRHQVSENDRVREAVELLEQGRVAELGQVLCASHVSLRDDFEVSCPELDQAVEAALAAGALGARMTGGGFGGSAIALCPDAESVAAAAAELGMRVFEVSP